MIELSKTSNTEEFIRERLMAGVYRVSYKDEWLFSIYDEGSSSRTKPYHQIISKNVVRSMTLGDLREYLQRCRDVAAARRRLLTLCK